MYRFYYFQSNYWMSFGGITSYNKYTGSITDVIYWVRHSTATETGGQTGHCWGMSEAGTVVDVIGSHYRTGEFLGQIIFFISTLCRSNEGKLVSFVIC